jgi:hypothetical protein
MFRIATVERSLTLCSTVKRPDPEIIVLLALLFLITLMTCHRLFHPTTITSRLNENFAAATYTVMAFSLASMLSA